MNLSGSHGKFLLASGLKTATIEIMGCYSVPPAEIDRLFAGAKTLRVVAGFPISRRQRLLPLPIVSAAGQHEVLATGGH